VGERLFKGEGEKSLGRLGDIGGGADKAFCPHCSHTDSLCGEVIAALLV